MLMAKSSLGQIDKGYSQTSQLCKVPVILYQCLVLAHAAMLLSLLAVCVCVYMCVGLVRRLYSGRKKVCVCVWCGVHVLVGVLSVDEASGQWLGSLTKQNNSSLFLLPPLSPTFSSCKALSRGKTALCSVKPKPK
jgi:hypothetical protein